MTSYISMLTLTVLATMAVAVISALPRGDLSGEQGNLYPAIYREQQLNDKDGRTLDSLDNLQTSRWNKSRMKRNITVTKKSVRTKRDGVSSQQPLYSHRYNKKEGGTLDSLGGGHLIRNLQTNNGYLQTKYHANKRSTRHYSNYNINNPNGIDKYSNFQLSKNNFEPILKNNIKRFTNNDGGNVVIDSIGGGHLVRDEDNLRDILDSIGGGHLLRETDRTNSDRTAGDMIDPLGGGHLLREFLDPLGGGHLVRRTDPLDNHQDVQKINKPSFKYTEHSRDILDSLGGGHLVRNDQSVHMDRDILDSLGGGHLLREFLDPLGGGHLIRGTDHLDSHQDVQKINKAFFKHSRDILDSLGGGHLVRNDQSVHMNRDILDSLGGGHLLREFLDPLGGGHLIRGRLNTLPLDSKYLERDILDSIGGGHLLRGRLRLERSVPTNILEIPKTVPPAKERHIVGIGKNNKQLFDISDKDYRQKVSSLNNR